MDIHFNGYKIKYQTLNSLLRTITSSQNIRNINVFINLDDLFHKLHTNMVDKEFQCCGKDSNLQLISNIFNLVGHYRNYCMKLGIDAKIFIIYTSMKTMFKNNMHVRNYRQHYLDINNKDNGKFYFVNNAISSSIDYLSIISRYIPGVYCINTGHLEPSTVPLFISNNVQADHNLMISRDEYDLQYSYRTEWSYLIPKGENSKMVNQQNVWQHIADKEKLDRIIQNYPTEVYPVMKSIVGDKYRNISRLKRCGWKTIFNYISDLYEEINSPDIPKEVLGTYIKSAIEKFITNKGIDTYMINNNIKATNIDEQVSTFLDVEKSMILMQIEDTENYRDLEIMNNELFRSFPLNLAFLTREKVQYENKQQMNYGASIL